MIRITLHTTWWKFEHAMEESELTTIVTNESAILRYMNGMSEQHIPLTISATQTDQPQKYQSSIARVEAENNQLVLHKLMPGGWQDDIKPMQDIEITCRMQHGTIKFHSLFSPLDDSENEMYCRIAFPEQLSKKQLRACFRVSLSKYESEISMELDEGIELTGTCKDLSIAGALFYLPACDSQITEGQFIEQCRLVIPDTLDISCKAKVCHVNRTAKNNTLVGLNLLDLDITQRIAIRSAMNKLERLNILKSPL